ncbi:hypothetical protein PPACK8108_LOCUS19695 [Phakopsora pachyrhizi]|uniref:Uncharacterized protein n=1 Tax=Phakopsora pachyrhizi TaxID=170000 RepID=A0AAV0BE65_PHAPC|nr:hypothetical protein PPACK8108_LOCUS19695 [Phakopsora pachyrhizi]
MDELNNNSLLNEQQPQHQLINNTSQKLINPSSIIDLNNLHNDLSIKKERVPPSLRKKQSQRFTVTNTSSINVNQPIIQATPEPPVPAIPSSFSSVENHQALSSPSISSKSDSEHNNLLGSLSQGSFNLSDPSPTTTANFTSPVSPDCHLPASNFVSSGLNQSVLMATTTTSPPPDVQDDEIIPTAIVIKNIPFTVKREQLLAVIEELTIPAPYAFNYHFDNGVFRGLAFANFRSASETDAAVAGLNGFDINGRKLRVEYKKVLQAGEKERIEREKALKRMRSMQLQKESINEPHQIHHHPQPLLPASVNMGYGSYSNSYEEDYRHLPRSSHSIHQFSSTNGNQSYNAPQQAFERLSIAGGAVESTKVSRELDMNDPQTLELYSRVLVFKEDNLRDELAFAKSLSGAQRRIVHQIAKKLGLEHRSDGLGEERFVVVTKQKAGSHRINRVASSANMNRGASLQQGGQQQIYNSQFSHNGSGNSSLLRMKKSMPDMRTRDMSHNNQIGGGAGYPEMPPLMKGIGSRKSTMNLRGGGVDGDLRSVVGHLHGQRPSVSSPGVHSLEDCYNLGNNTYNTGQILRQPRGPESCSGKGFGFSKMNSAKSLNPQNVLQHQQGNENLCFSSNDNLDQQHFSPLQNIGGEPYL